MTALQEAGRSLPLREVLRLRFMRTYLAAFFLDSTGDLLWYVTLGWVAGRAENHAVSALILCAGAVPALVLAPIGGALLGTITAARATVVTMCARFAVMITWIIAISLSATPLVALAVLAFVLGCIDGLHRPALETWPIDLAVDDDGNSVEGAQTPIAALERIVGRAAQTAAGIMGGLAIGLGGISAPTVLAAILFLVALAIFRALDVRSRSRRQAAAQAQESAGGFAGSEEPDGSSGTALQRLRSTLRSVGTGFASVRRHPVLSRTVPVHSWFNAVTAGLTLAGIPLKAHAEGWSASQFGWVYGAWGGGLLIGAVALATVLLRVAHKVFMSLSMVVVAGCLCVLMGFVPNPAVAASTAAALGLACGPVGATLAGYIREYANGQPRSVQGPVMGLQVMALDGFEPFGFVVVGGLSVLFGISWCFAIGGLSIVLLGCLALTSSSVRAATA